MYRKGFYLLLLAGTGVYLRSVNQQPRVSLIASE